MLKPFLIWPGGKRRLIPELKDRLPESFGKKITKYVEPFVGGGALMFHILSAYNLNRMCIIDSNHDVIIAYKVVRDNVEQLIQRIEQLQNTYRKLNKKLKQIFYYNAVDEYNEQRERNSNDIGQLTLRAANTIFLTYNCFNGMFRVNRQGKFNQTIGDPVWFDSYGLRDVSKALQDVEIVEGDFTLCEHISDETTFVYFDPPYLPVSRTSFFAGYTDDWFPEKRHVDLANLVRRLDKRGVKFLVSNSEPDNDYFDRLYSGFNIDRVPIYRSICAESDKRKVVNELMIYNYDRVNTYLFNKGV